MSDKSVLDGVPVNDEQMKDHFDKVRGKACCSSKSTSFLDIISNCPLCNSPIYGRKTIKQDEDPAVVRSCQCFNVKPTNMPLGVSKEH